MEKEVDGNSIPAHTSEKRQDIYQQLLSLHSDVTKVSNGVEEVEGKAKEMMSKSEVRRKNEWIMFRNLALSLLLILLLILILIH